MSDVQSASGISPQALSRRRGSIGAVGGATEAALGAASWRNGSAVGDHIGIITRTLTCATSGMAIVIASDGPVPDRGARERRMTASHGRLHGAGGAIAAALAHRLSPPNHVWIAS